MYENIYLQLYVFLYTLYGGIIIGIVYDVVDVLISGNIIKRRSITDLLFWAVAFTIVIGLLFYVNNITFRSYVLIGFALGWFLYFLTLSKLFRKIFIIIKNILKLVIGKVVAVLNIIFFPFKKLLGKKRRVDLCLKKIYTKIYNDFQKYKTYLFKS
ncbi:hypothetical protein GC105_03905 [Alkalibaculum sp. M08DMB]|uniref:Spore cortex biosynthesis protein YabQ n=1 Tax=Alkalibaculum sporogenes TaxID=2655001 RepID=A0A6A7K6G4_9FIRM|nr:spore cortex biosynthesis protein YabQ [Alkalibaculum sporogenes]MPW24931.1 hypothetical protein [Alkalibaculum sporogenes]